MTVASILVKNTFYSTNFSKIFGLKPEQAISMSIWTTARWYYITCRGEGLYSQCKGIISKGIISKLLEATKDEHIFSSLSQWKDLKKIRDDPEVILVAMQPLHVGSCKYMYIHLVINTWTIFHSNNSFLFHNRGNVVRNMLNSHGLHCPSQFACCTL
jgi:hypothetical protein